MIRLTLIGIIVFSGLLFLTGRNKPAPNDFVSFASFQDNEKINQKSTKTYIDTSTVTKSLEDIKISLGSVYGQVKEKTVAYLPSSSILTSPFSRDKKNDQPAKRAPVARVSKPKVASKTKTVAIAIAQPQKRKATKQVAVIIAKKPNKLSHNRFPLPVRKPVLLLASAAHKANNNQLASKPTLLASFKSFIINTTTPNKVPQFKRHATTQPTPPAKGRYQRSARLKRSKKHIDPRLLTVLIKRELHRLNCYKGAVSAHWDQRIQDRLKAIKAPLDSNAPSLKTLSYLENKNSLSCKVGNTQIVKAKPKTQTAQQLKTALSASHPQFTLPAHKSRALYTQSASNKSIQLRDRTGHLVNKPTKQTVKLANGSNSENTARSEAKNKAFALANEGKDFSFSGQSNSMRPPAFTVGMRQQATGSGQPSSASSHFGKPKTHKQAHKKKNRDWTKSIFSFD